MKFTKHPCPACGRPLKLTPAQRLERSRLATEALRRARIKRAKEAKA